jgi:hypothetical protein
MSEIVDLLELAARCRRFAETSIETDRATLHLLAEEYEARAAAAEHRPDTSST